MAFECCGYVSIPTIYLPESPKISSLKVSMHFFAPLGSGSSK
jgi:hypothetical protein